MTCCDTIKGAAEESRKHRTLTKQQFQRLCRTNCKITNEDALLDWLHNTGVLFFSEELFGGRIILDQNWALKAIYGFPLDGKLTFPVLNRHGRFTRRELERLIWQEFSIKEQELFLKHDGELRHLLPCRRSFQRLRGTRMGIRGPGTVARMADRAGLALGTNAGTFARTAASRFAIRFSMKGFLSHVSLPIGTKSRRCGA